MLIERALDRLADERRPVVRRDDGADHDAVAWLGGWQTHHRHGLIAAARRARCKRTTVDAVPVATRLRRIADLKLFDSGIEAPGSSLTKVDGRTTTSSHLATATSACAPSTR